jgi:muconate cycloisomerase
VKITQVRIHAVAVPPTPTALYRIEADVPLDEQLRREARVKWIAELETDDGPIGIGESHRGIAEEPVRESGVLLSGIDPLQLNLRALPLPQNAAYDLYEIALYDLVGKALNRSVCQLLGGPFREWVGIHYWMGKRTPEQSAQIAREGKGKGFTGIKIKVGKDAPDQSTLERVQAIAEAVGPDFEMVLDANGGFRRHPDLIGLAEQLSDYRVTMLEDPLPRSEHAATAELRQRIPIPIAYHALNLEQAFQAVRQDACDFMNVGVGSLAQFVRQADLADAAGVPSWHGSAQELGIRDAAYMHACAATPGCTISSDILHHLWEDDLIAQPIEIRAGQARVPESSGLGVELDRDALERYGVNTFTL